MTSSITGPHGLGRVDGQLEPPASPERCHDPGSRRVHLAKTVTWRLIATSTTIVISYLVTGDLAIGATIGGIEATAKMALYYGHERAWARLPRARLAGP